MQAHGFATTIANNADQVVTIANSQRFDLLILDLGLPDKDGLDVLQDLRGRGETLPIIVLTARDGVDDTVAGLNSGADDYITKPFRFEVLLARIRVQLRNRRVSKVKEETTLRVGDIVLDLLTREVWVGNRLVELSTREFILTEVFLRHPMQVMSREQLLNHIWGYDYDPGSNIVDVYIGYLRKKLGSSRIETIRGIGYRLRT